VVKNQFGLKTEFITLGQLLKAAGILGNGGEARAYLAEHEVFVNDELDCRRGRKLMAGQPVSLPMTAAVGCFINRE
jgi:ribosome-associated protein YbcJ (S4-like RNA binding protein)